MSEKQKLYLQILDMVLPYIRGLQTHGFWRRMRDGKFYAETELVHNLPRLLLYPEFQERDIHWLNTQARIFVDDGRSDFPFRAAICDNLKRLFSIVPPELQGQLDGRGRP